MGTCFSQPTVELKPTFIDLYRKAMQNRYFDDFSENDASISKKMEFLNKCLNNRQTLRITESFADDDNGEQRAYSVWYYDTIGSFLYFVMPRERFLGFFNGRNIKIAEAKRALDFVTNLEVNKTFIKIECKDP